MFHFFGLGGRKPPPAGGRPRLEALEDRLVPATIFVHNPNDGASTVFRGNVAPNLRSAVEHSQAGDVIALDNLTYRLTGGEGRGELDVTHDLTIRNAGGGLSVIDGQGQTRVLEISSGETAPVTAVVTGVEITHGDGNGGGVGGGIQVDLGAVLTLNNDIVTNNSVTGTPAQGGGIANFGTLTVNNSTVSNNRAAGAVTAVLGTPPPPAPAQGGGIFSSGGLLTLTNSRLSGNVAQGGQNVGVEGVTQGSDGDGGGLFLTVATDLTISGTAFTNNDALGGAVSGGDGGGLDSTIPDLQLTLTGCTFTGNTAQGGGGAVALSGNSSELILVGCSLSANTAEGIEDRGGGGIFTTGDPVTLTNSSVSGNRASAQGGGGIQTEGAAVTLLRSNVSNNSTTGDENGGGIDSEGGAVSLTDSTMIGNRATAGGGETGGGGAINSGGGNVTLLRSTVSNNSAAGNENGGGIQSGDGDVTLINSTMSGNRATGAGEITEGGGAIGSERGAITLINSTIYGNFAAGSEGGGGLDPEDGTVTLLNSIIAGNAAVNGPGPDIDGPVASASHSLIGNGVPTGLVNGVNGNLVGSTGHTIDPRLGPLQNNGGLTPTLALLPGSPAIDAGDDSVLGPPNRLAADQRGFPRRVGPHVDIGAFEFVPLPPPSPRGRRNGPL